MGLEWDIKNEHVGFGWKPFRGLGSKVVGSVIFWVVEWDICEGQVFIIVEAAATDDASLVDDGEAHGIGWSGDVWIVGSKDKWNLNGIERDRTQVSWILIQW